MATAPDEITFEEASAPETAPEEISFEEGHGIDPEAIKRGIQLGTGLTQTVQRAITSPAAAEASQMGREQGPMARLLAEDQAPLVQPPREVIGPMPGREATEPYKMGDYTITPAQEGIGIPYVRPPEEAGTVEKVAAGAFNTLAGIPNFMLSLPGVATMAAPAALPARFLSPALRLGFGAVMAKATIQAVDKALQTKDPQDIAEAIGAGGFTMLIAKGAKDPAFQAEVLKQRRLKQASVLLSDQIKRAELTSPETARVERVEPERPLTTVTTATGEKIQVPKGQEPPATAAAPELTPLTDYRAASKMTPAQFHDWLQGHKEAPTNAGYKMSEALVTPEQIAEAESLEKQQRAKAADMLKRAKETPEGPQRNAVFAEAMQNNSMIQYFGEAARMAKARDAVLDGKTVEAAASEFGVAANHLQPIVDNVEKITAAAYRPTEGGPVETGPHHPGILERLGVKGFEKPESRNTPQFGFQTTKRPFITREEAGPVATKSHQDLKKFEPGEPVHSDEVAAAGTTTPISETTPEFPVGKEAALDFGRKNFPFGKIATVDEAGKAHVLSTLRHAGVPIEKALKIVEGKIPFPTLDEFEKGADGVYWSEGSDLASRVWDQLSTLGMTKEHFEKAVPQAKNFKSGKEYFQAVKTLADKLSAAGGAELAALVRAGILPKADLLKPTAAAGRETQGVLQLPERQKLTEDQIRDLVAQAAQIVRTRKLTSPERANLAREMENARQGNPEALQKLVESLSRAVPKEAPKIKGGPRGKFDAETAEHGEDILSWMAENAKVLSKSGAQKAGRYKGNPGEWADAPSKLSAVHHGVIFSENGSLPSEVAQIAFNERKISAPTSTALWAAIEEASRKRKGAVEGAARAAKLAAEEGPQFERWQAATTAPRDTHPIELTTEELKVGDTIKVEGETLRVTAKDPDSGELKLVNGDRFGSQILQEGEKIYVAEHIEKPTTERPGEVFSMTEQHPGGEAGAAILAHGTPSGLPVGVPDGGPHFGSELMAAAQRLGTIIRTRTTLGPGVLGQYSRSKRAGVVYADKIEVGNLQNQSTMAHEMGHDLDQLLWPGVDLAYSMRSLAQRAGITGNGRELHNELMKVSTYMRGEAKGSKAYVEYRKRAAELIADHFALYAHDPALARSLAPEWTKALEKQLAKNKDAAETIKELHAGNVTPAIPTAAAAAPVGAAAGMPGRVPPVLPPVAVSPDAGLFYTAAQAVKGLVRKFKMEVIRAQIIADEWRKLVPQQMQRYDVGAAVEGTGNLEIPGDTIEAVRARMTPEMLTMFKRYKFAIENVRGNVNEFLKGMTEGEYLDFVKDYLPHFYDIDSKQGKIALGRFLKNSPNAKQRKIPTLQEAVTYGLRPITQDPAVLYELHSRINWRVATNRMLIGQLGEMKTASGQPVLVPWSEEPGGYVRSDNPLIQRVYAMKGKGGTMLWRGGAGIHPDAWTAVRQMLEMPTSSTLATAYDTVNSIARANAFAFSFFHDITLRAAAAGAGAIHLGIPRTVGEIPQKINPFRGLVRIFEKNPLTGELEIFRSTKKLGQELMSDEEAATDAARHGLVFSWNDSESYQMAARDFLEKAAVRWKDNPILGPTSRVLRDLQMLRQRQLWKNTHDAYKIIAYHDLTSKALAEAPPGTNPSAVKEQIASMLNDAFGGQEWQTKFWLSPQNRRMLSRAFLAPDWTFSTLRSVPMVSDTASIIRGQAPRIVGREPIPTLKEGWNANMLRYKFWRGELAAIATATLAAQYAIYRAFGNKDKGDKEWVWENEDGQRTRVDITPIMRKLPWKDPNDPTRYYMNLGKRPQEILAYFTQADQIIMSKAARPVAEVLRQVTGTEGDFKAQWKRDHETFLESIPQRSLKAAGTFLPFVFSGNQFAFSVPYRKGMTKYKAQQAFESTYELAADPGMFPSAKAFLRGVPSPKGTLDEMVASITDAAERNGVPSEEIRKRALSTIRGKYYDKFFKASKKGDDKAMEKAAQALENLGATGAEIFRSVKRRTALEPYAE